MIIFNFTSFFTETDITNPPMSPIPFPLLSSIGTKRRATTNMKTSAKTKSMSNVSYKFLCLNEVFTNNGSFAENFSIISFRDLSDAY